MRVRPPILLLPLLAFLLALPAGADAAVTCPNPNPVVNENNCMGAGSTAWRLTNYDQGGIVGYTTKSSVNLGEGVTLRLANQSGSGSAEVNVFRMGWYGGAGGRLVYQNKKVAIANERRCEAPDETTGYWSCENWENSLTVPAGSLPASGIYLAHITDLSTGQDNQLLFVVRNDARQTPLLYKLPTATYQAYNSYNGHSLYRFNSAGFTTITGTSRAVKVSFDRPYVNSYDEANWFLKADFPMVAWLEREGYEVDYTESVSVDSNPGQLLKHKTLVLSGHDEYWSGPEMAGYKAARDAGVNIASFSGNTGYWRVRYEDNGRTLVCYKAVEGTKEGSVPDGSKGVNDWGPDGLKGTKDDALGLDGKAGTSDDNPQYATTTWRDDGAPPGNPNAPSGGRVGPNEPENSLLGSMYVGDNDNFDYPLTVPATNDRDEFSGDRIWRNTGISESSDTKIGTNLNGWEWDSIPTQAQYLSREPSGVKRLTLSDLGSAPSPPEWIQDEGLLYSTLPPPGQPSTVSAVKYTAASGALVFAAGTIQWSWGLAPHYLNKPSESFEDPPVDSSDPRIQQATYNVFADGGVQPDTPVGVLVDGNEPPAASFTATPNPASAGSTIAFDAGGSSDADGTIVKYEWDLDGNGSFETDTGSSPVVSKPYPNPEEVPVRLRVIDSGGATDQAVRVLVISSGTPGNKAPQAAFTISPNPAPVESTVTFNAAGSSDPDGSVVKYEWDLDGNGSYETNTGSSPLATRSYPSEGNRQIGLRVTDNSSGTATVSHALIVGHGSTYSSEVLGTTGLRDYWRLGEKTGSSFADPVGNHPATGQGGFSLGTAGAIEGDLDTAASFDGATGAAGAPLDLSGTSQLTLEFWLNWSNYATDDDLAFEFTPNFNLNNGGFLVDPNAGELGGKFGIGIGSGESRNNAYFARPSAGAWHHYAIVFDTKAAAAQQITPYVDGKAVPFEKLNSGIGAGNFANSTLYFMSRAGSSLFGKGSLDEVSLYGRTLSAAEVNAHYQASRSNKSPIASFTATPDPATVGDPVSLDASGSSDPDGSIAKYEWDLDGNGSFETNTGTSPKAATSFGSEGGHQVALRVTDNGGATDTLTRTVTVQNHALQASFTASPTPVAPNATVTLDGSASTSPSGTITNYEWDLDGNGTYETSSGTSPTTTTSYPSRGEYQVGLRITGEGGTTATTVRTVYVGTSYSGTISSTPGLTDYWRLGEKSGSTLADSVGSSPATLKGGVALGVPGALEFDPDSAVAFDGLNGAASAPVDYSATNKLTVEFWLNWAAYANDDDLALELTPNFNENDGGFLVDPNAGEFGGRFGVAIGRGESRNNVYFARPSAGEWHHYAFVLDTTASAGQQITPYVDGKAVPYDKLSSGTGAGNFAKSSLFLMSRNASALFGKGSLDELAVYNRVLSGSEVLTHYLARGGNKAPLASFTATPNPVETNAPVAFNGFASSDVDGTVNKYEWDLDGNGSYETATGSSPTAAKTYPAPGQYNVGLRVTDDDGSVGISHVNVTVRNQPPTATFTATPAVAPIGTTVSLDASGSSDPDGSIAKYEWDLDGNGSYETDTGTTPTAGKRYTHNGDVPVGLRITDSSGETATATRTVTVVGSYFGAVTATPGLVDYWRLGEPAGNFADGSGGNTAIAEGGITYGAPGALAADPNKAAAFEGTAATASAKVDYSGTSKLTVEFWLNWAAYANNDQLAMELTPNFNENDGGFLVDPNAGELGGRFGVGIGRGASRNNAYFERPSAGAWHHYTLVFDSAAPAAQQVIPYVDGKAVPFNKTASGTGAGNFASSRLFFMSRNATTLFGKGKLDELAVYNRALSAAEVAAHYDASINKAPLPSFSATPNPVAAGVRTTFDASASTDPDGAVVKYEWDLDGNGSYETNSGETPTATASYPTSGTVQVGLRTTDDGGETATTSRIVNVLGTVPTASFTATPNPVTTADQVGFDASGSTDPEGPIARYEWDLDGNGSYETDTGATPTATRSYAAKGPITIGLRVTDGDGATATASVGLTVQNRAPSATFTAAPNPVQTQNKVTFDASGSVDSDGTIVKYEWDLDGNGSYETDTGTTPSAASSFATAGDREVGLRVSDDDGATATAARTVTVQNRPPTASFTATPNPVVTGAEVSFNASGASDPDGTIAKYEWDLDGNGSYETDTGTTPSAAASYPAAANISIGLRVTDNNGDTGTASKAVTVQNRPPAASFTAAPDPAPTGTQISFDASASSDPDGTVVKYEWDLDGNGSFETDTGTTPSATKAFAVPGTPGVGLRVTDNDGGTATTTRTVTVTNRAPTASFTAAPDPAPTGTSVTFNAAGSTDPDGTIAKYEWDLDGNGSFETSTGTTATTTKAFATPGTFSVGLRVTDNNGSTATATSTVTAANRAPTASFTATPSTAPTGTSVTFNGSGSTDPDGTIAKYEWDFDNNGTYETTSATATTTKAFATPGTFTVGLRVTDNLGLTATTTRTVTAQNRAPEASFTATPNPVATGTAVNFDASASTDADGTVTKYEWDLDGNGTYETSTGTTPTTSKTYASASTPTIRLRVTDNNGATGTASRVLTVQNRLPTASFTATPSTVVSGSSVTFNGSGSTDPDGTIAKYEWDFDGNGSFETSTGTTATSTRAMSTAGTINVGLRVTDNNGGTATTTRTVTVTNRAPTASFTATPNPVPTGTNVAFNGAGSTDPDGTVTKYEWDLDGNGTYETSTGATATTTNSYATAGTVTVGLRVTDNLGLTATTSKAVTVQNRAPVASLTATPNPLTVGATATFNGAASTDPDGTVTKYEWDLDGNGTYETSTGATATASKAFTTSGNRTIGLRVTDNAGATGTGTVVLNVQSGYAPAVTATAGLSDYWRLAETSGTSLVDAVGGRTATTANSPTLGVAGALAGGTDSNTAVSFNGSNESASAPLNLSGTNKLTIEFWLKWSSYSNNDDLAFEFTSNSSNINGGFFADPNSPELGGRFGVGIGRLTSRNTSYFARPSANVWHHYAFVLDSSAAAAQQVVPYVDGAPVAYTKPSSGTGAGNFANSTLYFMSRGGSSLFGSGSLDEVAIYNRALSAAEIASHFKAASP